GPRLAAPSGNGAPGRPVMGAESGTILVIEDDTDTRDMLSEAFRMEGYRVLAAGDCARALEEAAAEAPDLIVLDLVLPGQDRVPCAEELRRRGLRLGVPVLIVSADARVAEKARELGAEGYLAKPFELDELLGQAARLRELARSQRGRLDYQRRRLGQQRAFLEGVGEKLGQRQGEPESPPSGRAGSLESGPSVFEIWRHRGTG